MTRVCIRLHTGEIFEDHLLSQTTTHLELARRGRLARTQVAALATYKQKTGD